MIQDLGNSCLADHSLVASLLEHREGDKLVGTLQKVRWLEPEGGRHPEWIPHNLDNLVYPCRCLVYLGRKARPEK